MKQFEAEVLSNERLWGEHLVCGHIKFSSTHRMWLRCPDIAQKAKPGQFVMAYCGVKCILPRPLSIHRSENDKIALFYAVLAEGKGTPWLSERRKSDRVSMMGPLGNGFFLNSTSQNLLLVAGGNGIAALYFLAQEAAEQNHHVRLLYGTKDEKRLPIPPVIETIPTTEDGSVGHKGVVLDLIKPEVIKWADQVFACGPTAMYRDMVNRKKELGLTGKSVQITLEMRMGCGRGVCYGCTVKTKGGLKQVCHDGPVFELNDIIWDELSPKL